MPVVEAIAMPPPIRNVPTRPDAESAPQTPDARPQTRITDPTTEPGWDAMVQSLPGHTFFHSAAWARVLKEAYGFTPMYLVLERRPLGAPASCRQVSNSAFPCQEQDLAGKMPALPGEAGAPTFSAILPLMECRSWLRGTRGVSLPFTDACPALKSPKSEANSLIETVLTHGRERNWRFAEFRGDNDIAASFPAVSPSATHWGHVLDLTDGADATFARLDPAVRRAVRKADKAYLQIDVTRDRAALRQFYRLHCLTRARHGVPPQPFSFFAAIQKHVIDAGHGFVVLASTPGGSSRGRGNEAQVLGAPASCRQVLRHPAKSKRERAQVIAASVYFQFGGRAIYKFGASDVRFQDLRANNLVMWTAIQHLARERFSTLDFGRTDPSNEGLRAFKLGWGTTETRLPYFRYDFRSKTFVGERRPSRLAGRLGWLPGPMARLAGAVLYPHWE